MKTLLLAAASGAALAALAGCAPGKPTVRAALDCPATHGELTRTAAAPDGRSCTYVTSEGAEVTLQLVATNGNPKGVLERIEQSLSPPMTAEEKAAEAKAAAAAGTAVATTTASPGSAGDAAAAAREAEADAGRAVAASGESDKTTTAKADAEAEHEDAEAVAQSDGDVTRVRLPGISITAGDDQANVKVGGVTIDADSDGATIRRYDDVRLKGQALSPEKRGVRATLVRKGEFAGGYRVVGYEAGGPKAGPIAVATVRSKTELDHHGGDIYDDIKDLVRRNGGV